MRNPNWTREQTILAFELYCRTSFGRLHDRNPDVIELAKELGRTSGALAYKLVNLASVDPSIPQKGATHCSKLDEIVFHEFSKDFERLLVEADKAREKLGIQLSGFESLEEVFETDKSANVILRRGQSLFRRAVLTNFDQKCCLTEIKLPEFLIASHIVPWSQDKANRLNPRNGLCLNVFHDKAFDKGLISFDDDYRVILSGRLRNFEDLSGLDFVLKSEGRRLPTPLKFWPDKQLIKRHRTEHGF